VPSERQLEANRINASKSRGPVTPEGRAKSALNSLRHGLLADTVVLEGESVERFTSLLTALNEEFDPQSATESALIENMATARWREMRLWSIEKSGLEREMGNQTEGSPANRAAKAFRTLCDQTNVLELLNRYESRFDRQYCRALTRLLDLKARRKNTFLPNETLMRATHPRP
jgi:hypothetical protein